MSLKSNLLARVGKNGQEVAAAEAVEIAVMKNVQVWNNQLGELRLDLMEAKSALRRAESDATVTPSSYVELQREVTALEADIKAVQDAQAVRFGE